jgi:hypothetical protein
VWTVTWIDFLSPPALRDERLRRHDSLLSLIGHSVAAKSGGFAQMRNFGASGLVVLHIMATLYWTGNKEKSAVNDRPERNISSGAGDAITDRTQSACIIEAQIVRYNSITSRLLKNCRVWL